MQKLITLGKNHIPHLLIFAIVFAGGYFYTGILDKYNAGILFGGGYSFKLFSLLYLGALLLNIHAVASLEKARRKEGWQPPVPVKICLSAVMLLAVPAISFYLEEMLWNDSYHKISTTYWLLNYTLLLVLELSFGLICQSVAAGCYLPLVLGLAYGFVNYYLLLFRASILTPSDLFVLGTAAQVAGSYDYSNISTVFVLALVCFLCVLPLPALLRRFFYRVPRKARGYVSLSGAALFLCFCLVVFQPGFFRYFNVGANSWAPVDSARPQGCPITFCKMIQNMRLQKPEGYSESAVLDALSPFAGDVSMDSPLEEMPTVIVIMNESLTDLQLLGEFSSDPYLANINALEGCLQRGWVYSSVPNGGTCNVEFEFLTGNSMANCPAGVFPYRSYKMDTVYNLPSVFKSLGYETVALHPYKKDNWNRTVVYNQFQFDRFIGEEDMDVSRLPKDYYLNWSIADWHNYEYVIDIYENRSGPLFLFNITMQNHGGYGTDVSKQVPLIQTEPWIQSYPDVMNYLTLVRESDSAFQDLIDYFSQQEEPVIICMFGDHWPNLSADFITRLGGESTSLEDSQRLFMTPYLIWSNFTDTETVYQDLSTNYLGANLLRTAGIRTAYSDYLLQLQQEIPIFNLNGYQTSDRQWHTHNEENQLLTMYRWMQYYQMTKGNR